MKTSIFNLQSDVKIDALPLREIARAVIQLERVHFDEVSLHYVNTEEICFLHAEFFDDPSPTDCISFPLDTKDATGYKVLGDVFVCPATALEYSREHGTDPLQEVVLYTVHGLLHLLGYDDLSETDEPIMRQKERDHLENLKKLHLI